MALRARAKRNKATPWCYVLVLKELGDAVALRARAKRIRQLRGVTCSC